MDVEARKADIRRKIERDYPYSEEPAHITPEAYERWLDGAVSQALRAEERESRKKRVARAAVECAKAEARAADARVEAEARAAMADTARREAARQAAKRKPRTTTTTTKPAAKPKGLAAELNAEVESRVRRSLGLDPEPPAPTKTSGLSELERKQAEAIRKSLGA